MVLLALGFDLLGLSATTVMGHFHDGVGWLQLPECFASILYLISELNVDNWNDDCEAKSEAKSPRTLRGLQVDSTLTRNVPYAVR